MQNAYFQEPVGVHGVLIRTAMRTEKVEAQGQRSNRKVKGQTVYTVFYFHWFDLAAA